jgi:hypothetical protein
VGDALVGDVAIVIPTARAAASAPRSSRSLPETKTLIAEIRAQRARCHATSARRPQRKRPPAATDADHPVEQTRAVVRGLPTDSKRKSSTPRPRPARTAAQAPASASISTMRAGRSSPACAKPASRPARSPTSWAGPKRVWSGLLKTYVDQDAIILGIAERIRATEESE